MARILAPLFCLASIACATSCSSVETRTPPTSEQVHGVEQFLFVQNARSGSFDGERLTLDNSPPVIFFSDRPYRMFGQTSQEAFIAAWNRGPNSFAKDSPNAILSLIGGNHVDSFMVELSEPKYANGAFSYKVKVEDGTIPAKFEESSLFIDNNLWAAVGGLAAGHFLTRRSEEKKAAAYEAGAASALQSPSYYVHAEPAPLPAPPPPPPSAPPPQQSVPSLLSQAVAEMETYCKTANPTDANYVKQLIGTLKSVDGDFQNVSK